MNNYYRDTIDRMCELSPNVSEYINSEMFRMVEPGIIYDESHGDLSIDTFASCIEMISTDLLELGIGTLVDKEDILDNPSTTDGLLSLLDIFNKERFTTNLKACPKDHKILYALVYSDAIEVTDTLAKVVEHLSQVGIGDSTVLEQASYVLQYVYSNESFRSKIVELLDLTPVVHSSFSDVNIDAYNELTPVVIQIVEFWHSCFDSIVPAAIADHSNYKQDMCRRYIGDYLEVEAAEHHLWMLHYDPNSSSPHTTKAYRDLIQEHRTTNPGYIEYCANKNKTIPLDADDFISMAVDFLIRYRCVFGKVSSQVKILVGPVSKEELVTARNVLSAAYKIVVRDTTNSDIEQLLKKCLSRLDSITQELRS